MKIVCADNIVELTKKNLADTHPYRALQTLLAYPELAREKGIHVLLLNVLLNKEALGYRVYAARVLHKIGDPLGLLHLTYNSLRSHPILKVRQDNISGWSSNLLLHYAGGLTDESTNLLLKELNAPRGYVYVDVLSSLSDEKIIPRVLPLLGAPRETAMAAAYILAMKRRDEGRRILEELAESQKYVELALIALSHIPGGRTLEYLRAYADPLHPIYQRKDEFIVSLLRHAENRLFFLECKDSRRVSLAMERFYMHPLQNLMTYAREQTLRELNDPGLLDSPHRLKWQQRTKRWISPPSDFNPSFFIVNSSVVHPAFGTGVCAPDFLYEFSTTEDRAYCAEIQRSSIRALLNVADSTDWESGDVMGVEPRFLWGLSPIGDYYLPGFTISYEPEDYVRAATEWILEPQKYRFGSYRPLANYESEAFNSGLVNGQEPV